MKQYQSREYCKDVRCPSMEMLPGDKKLHSCKSCGSYQFHQWLKDNGYKISKEE